MKGSDRRGRNDWGTMRQRIESVPGRQNTAVNQKNSEQPKDTALGQNAARQPMGDAGEPKKLHVSLQLSLPSMPGGRLRKKHGMVFASLVIIGLAGVGVYRLIDSSTPNDTRDVLSDAVLEPEYDTVLPEGKREETEGGKIGYDAQRKVASFKDNIGDVSVTVSQQPLPEAFKANPDEEIKKIADNFSATEIINEANPRIYLGNDIKGPQTVIFHKNNVLVFILSSQQIDNKQWVTYIEDLR